MIGLSRRHLLAGLAGGFALIGLALAAPATERRLVFIVLRGAMDGIAMVMPPGDPAYAALHGNFRPPPDAGAPLRLDSMWTLHPTFAQVGALYGRDDGWLNRLLPLLPGAEPAVALTATIPMALRGAAAATLFAASRIPDADAALLARVEALYQDDVQLHTLWGQAMDARDTAGADAQGSAKPQGARVAMLEIGGWDTHANQPGRLAGQQRQRDATIAALRSGLGAAWRQTMIVAATEFGRTAAPNGTGGTDHGTGGAAIFAGGALTGGRVVADGPGLAPAQLLEGRDLKPTLDPRAVVAGLAGGHFGIEPGLVAARVFGAPQLRTVGDLVRS